MAKARGAKYRGSSQAGSQMRDASGARHATKLKDQNHEIKALLESEHINAGDRVLKELNSLKSSQAASRKFLQKVE